MSTPSAAVPGSGEYAVIATAPGIGPGNWAGAPSAALARDGSVVLAYRVRSAAGRGAEQVLARSIDGGVTFINLGRWSKEAFGAESLERPALVFDGTNWHLYVSCATPGSKHWRIDLLRATTIEGLLTATPLTVFPGDRTVGVKDPVIRVRDGRWYGWICCHPLAEPGAEDRMTTRPASSPDGIEWTWEETALAGRPGEWDARGARATAVLAGPTGFSDGIAYYDGRATAEENFAERTGIAVAAPGGRFISLGGPIADVRYLDVLDLGDGTSRFYYEAPLGDGSHELRTELARG